MRVGTSSPLMYAQPGRRRPSPGTVASTSAEPTDRVERSKGVPPPNPWPELEKLGLVVAGDTTGGPIGTALTESARRGLLSVFERTERGGVQLERERRFRLPWIMKKRVRITPKQALNLVAKATERIPRLHAVAPGGVDHQVQDLYDLKCLDLGFGAGAQVAAPEEQPLLEALEHIQNQGNRFQCGDGHTLHDQDVVGAFDELTRERSSIYIKDNQGARSVGNRREDLFAYEFFDGSGRDWGLTDVRLAGDLRAAAASGYTACLNINQEAISPSKAYARLLRRGENSSLFLKREGKPGVEVDRCDLGDLDRVESRLRELHELYDVIEPALSDVHFSGWEGAWRNPLQAPNPPFGLEERARALKELIEAAAPAFSDPDLAVLRAGKVLEVVERGALDLEQFRRRILVAADGLSNGVPDILESLNQVSELLHCRGATPSERGRLEDLFYELLRSVGSVSVATEGLDLVRVPSGDETQASRVALFEAIAAQEDDLERTAEHYCSLLTHRGPDESLSTAGDRFLKLIEGMSIGHYQRQTSEVFQLVQYGLKSAKYDGERADRMVDDFLQALLVTESVDKAVESVIAGEVIDRGIQKDEDGVIIGGVRIRRK